MTLTDPKDGTFYEKLLSTLFTNGSPSWPDKELPDENDLVYRLARNRHLYDESKYIEIGLENHPKLLRVPQPILDSPTLTPIPRDNAISCFPRFRALPLAVRNRFIWVGVSRLHPLNLQEIQQHLMPGVLSNDYNFCWCILTPYEGCKLYKQLTLDLPQ